MPSDDSSTKPGRLDGVMSQTSDALRELRVTDSAGALSGRLAQTWHTELGPTERSFLLAAAAQAASPNDAMFLVEFLDGILMTHEEIENQKWKNFCSDAQAEDDKLWTYEALKPKARKKWKA